MKGYTIGSMVTLPEALSARIASGQNSTPELAADALARFRQANELLEQGEPRRAVTEYEGLLRLFPDEPSSLNNLGVALDRLGKHEKALAAYDRVLALQAGDAVAQHNRGVALAQLDRYEEAVDSYKRALELEPDDPGTMANLGLALAHLGKLDEAFGILDKALELSPDDPDITRTRRTLLDVILYRLRKRGLISWGGGKPKGMHPRVRLTPGQPLSQYIIESRR